MLAHARTHARACARSHACLRATAVHVPHAQYLGAGCIQAFIARGAGDGWCDARAARAQTPRTDAEPPPGRRLPPSPPPLPLFDFACLHVVRGIFGLTAVRGRAGGEISEDCRHHLQPAAMQPRKTGGAVVRLVRRRAPQRSGRREGHAAEVHWGVVRADARAAGRSRAARAMRRAGQLARIRIRKGREARRLSSDAAGRDPRAAGSSEEAALAA